MRPIRQIVAMILTVALFIMPLSGTGLAESIAASQTGAEVNEKTDAGLLPALVNRALGEDEGYSPRTWGEAARAMCRLLGYIEEDAEELKPTAYSGILAAPPSSDDDTVYLGLLAGGGYLADVTGPIDPADALPEGEWNSLLTRGFPDLLLSQEEADELTAAKGKTGLLLSGEKLSLTALDVDRLAALSTGETMLSGVKADAFSALGAGKTYLKSTQIERVLISDPTAEDVDDGETYFHIDTESSVSEVVVMRSGHVTIEGNGALGIVRVLEALDGLSIRATGSVINETSETISVEGPDGQAQDLAPGALHDFVLETFVVNFITEGTPVASQLLPPGETPDFAAAATEKEGLIFTAWYEDAAYTMPVSTLMSVDGEKTLYARFVEEAEAITVTLEAHGGLELPPLKIAQGEYLLVKPVQSLYTYKEGTAFGGWFADEACTEPFGYTEPIDQDITLYALFLSDEQIDEESYSDTAELKDMDWRAEIPLTVPEGMALGDLAPLFSVETGSGALEPQLAFRETESGYALYGAYYERDGESGFEPGATFVITASGGVGFAGHGEGVERLTVSVYKEEIERVEFAEGLTYVMWDQVQAFEPVRLHQGADGEEGETQPGSIVLTGTDVYAPGEIVVFYDGRIDPDEKNISAWDGGDFAGYVLFAEVLTFEEAGDGAEVSFIYANPEEYMAELELHTTREVDVEEMLDDDQIARLQEGIIAQVASNDELRAQMMIAVMTAPETQHQLDEMYGQGAYQLARVSASIRANRPQVSISLSGNSVTVGLSIGATVSLSDGGETLLTINTTLRFEEKVQVSTTTDGGWLWVDVAVSLVSTTSISLTITANTGKDSDLSILSGAVETLEQLVTPDGLNETMDYMDSVNELMNTMRSLVSTSLPYTEIFAIPIFQVGVSFYGIVTLSVKLELIGEVGILASFGVEIVVVQGERIGFKYDFTKLSGGTYSQKLDNRVDTRIHLIGKLGARVGLRLTISLSLFSVASASISGTVYAYAELTGMYFFTASLLTGNSTSVGGLRLEVGIDASISLKLSVGLGRITKSRSWTVWKDRWPLFSKSWSSKLSLMDVEQLEEMWAKEIERAGDKSAFGFGYVPMNTYSLFDGNVTQGQLLWNHLNAGGVSATLTIENLVIDGEPVLADDPRAGVLSIGEGSPTRSRGMVYLDEVLAAEYEIRQTDCDVVLTYEDNSSSALVKKQSHRFSLSRACEFSVTTVNVEFVLRDWCAGAWGIESAGWDGATVYQTQLRTSHLLGRACAPTETAAVDLQGIIDAAIESYPALGDISLAWNRRTATGTDNSAIQYSTPLISSYCYLMPTEGMLRYDVTPNTHEYSLRWYLYAFRFPGYTGEIEYRLNVDNAADSDYDFSVHGALHARPMHFAAGSEPNAWTLRTKRASFDGANKPLLMAVDGATPIATGLSMNGREAEETVYLKLNLSPNPLNIERGEGVAEYAFVSPQMASGDLVAPGTEITLALVYEPGYRSGELRTAQNLPYTAVEDSLSFVMPVSAVDATLLANPAHQIDYQYNYGDLGLYQTAYVAANERVFAPQAPSVSGLTFRGWYDNPACEGEPYAFGELPTGNLTLYADWTCNVTVNFSGATGPAAYMDDEGELQLFFEGDNKDYRQYTFSLFRVGETLPQIMTPNLSGYDFLGWYLSPDFAGEVVDLAHYVLAGGVTLYARWAKVIAVKYEWNIGDLGTYYQTMEYANQPMADVPEAPEFDWYRFDGWYTRPECPESAAFDLTTDCLSADTTLYAGWTAEAFPIQYGVENGENDGRNPSHYTVEDGDISLFPPTRTGYRFVGWTGTDLTEPTIEVTIPAGTHGDRTYTALWTPVVYTITCHPLRGEVAVANPTEYTIESPDITLNNPFKEKYTFMGWRGTELDEPMMEVVIPTGSTGDRVYTGTWHTDDPDAKIAERALALIQDAYTYDIDVYVDGTGAGSSLYTEVRTAIDGDEGTAPYAQAIELVLTKSTQAPLEDGVGYTHDFVAEIIYTNDDGTKTSLEKAVRVTVKKRVPTIEALPKASALERNQTLSMSKLVGGVATYDGEGLGGWFGWKPGDGLDEVPSSAKNGQAIYNVMFTPNDTKLYACVEGQIAVQMQIGVRVEIEADSRDYIADDTRTTGSYVLWDVDAKTQLPNNILLEGETYHFEKAGADDEPIAVTCTGYKLDPDTCDTELYALESTTATADAYIRWITPTFAAPTIKETEVYYGLYLVDLTLDGELPKHGVADVPGEWQWDDPLTFIADVGTRQYLAVFMPDDELGYRSVTANVEMVVEKQKVDEPDILGTIYTGNAQTPAVPISDKYTSDPFDAYIDAGTHEITLRLNDDEHYRWASDATKQSKTAKVSFVIAPATLTLDKADVGIMKLGYGQQLTAGVDQTIASAGIEKPRQLSAKTMITGAKVTFDGAPVGGKWVWSDANFLEKALSVGSHTVTARYEVENGGSNFEPLTDSFTVIVEKARPNPATAQLTASSMYQSTPARNDLSKSELNAEGFPVNPATGEEVRGTWSWEKETDIPETSEVHNVVFTPDLEVAGNYEAVLSEAVTVELVDYVTVEITHESNVAGDTVARINAQMNGNNTWFNESTIQFRPGEESIGLYFNPEPPLGGKVLLLRDTVVSVNIGGVLKEYRVSLSEADITAAAGELKIKTYKDGNDFEHNYLYHDRNKHQVTIYINANKATLNAPIIGDFKIQLRSYQMTSNFELYPNPLMAPFSFMINASPGDGTPADGNINGALQRLDDSSLVEDGE